MSCGLEYNLALNPPEYVGTSIVDSTFTLRITDANSESEFRGLELYYKFYSRNDTELEINYSSHEQLGANGFRRINSDSDKPGNISLPLLKVPPEHRGFESTIDIDFSDLGDAGINAQGSSADSLDLSNMPIRRGIVSDDQTSFRRFNEYEPYYDDGDLLSVDQDFEGNDEIKLLMYAVSFGRQQDSLSPAYSKAICLFFIEISLKG